MTDLFLVFCLLIDHYVLGQILKLPLEQINIRGKFHENEKYLQISIMACSSEVTLVQTNAVIFLWSVSNLKQVTFI